jgi:predicted dehydrogenase
MSLESSTDDLRIGILGAARIAPAAVVKPARAVDGVRVTAIAARDTERAHAFAKKHGVDRVLDTYDALVADPDVDAVYVPLPNGLHAEWTKRALEDGKHVLCEKPFTANAGEAEDVRELADAHPDLVVMEAFHYRYHPVAQRVVDIVNSGVLGTVRRVETAMCIPLPLPRDIRYRYDLAGGSVMDVGCYAIHMLRTASGEEPSVKLARARLASPDVDRWMQATFTLPSGAEGKMTCALWSSTLLRIGVTVGGDDGELRLFNPTGPHLYHRLTVWTRGAGGGRRRERVAGSRTPTYSYQLEAFRDAVRGDRARNLTPPVDSVANMRVVDAVYDAAGLRRRGT